MNKKFLRSIMKEKRSSVLESERRAAENSLCGMWEDAVEGLTLSYASFGTELCTYALNRRLAEQNRLVLPICTPCGLRLYKVSKAPAHQKFGFFEPDESCGQEVTLKEISQLFVPALAFENRGFRLGYGQGHYDRLLKNISAHTLSIGVGFKVQKLELLPIETHDIPVQQICLF